MIIVGAGMSGLLAAHILRRFSPVVIEAQPSLPNNHAALLRFRTDAVSLATGIPFKKVYVQKAICLDGQLYERSSIKLNNMYAAKVSGLVMGRSIMNLEPGERYIAPLDFISQMAKSVNVEYNTHLTEISAYRSESMVSTIPMSALMKLVGWDAIPSFGYQSIRTITAEIEGVDVYQTLYYPGTCSAYRASITGNKIIIEMVTNHLAPAWIEEQELVDAYASDFGIKGRNISNVSSRLQKFGKIIPCDDSIRRQFILAMTDKYRIYSVGRFATWRQLLMDDVVKDISLVERMIDERSSYSAHLNKAS